jgi:PIN domain nuclease of toxin-antitoxin system
MTPLLLDTCAVIWAAEDQLSPEAAERLNQRFRDGEPVYVSPITAWELGMLFSRSRLRASVSPAEYWRRIAATGVALAGMPPEVLLESNFLPGDFLHDPADRIVAATARAFGLTVMTRDRSLLAFAQEGYLSAVTC